MGLQPRLSRNHVLHLVCASPGRATVAQVIRLDNCRQPFQTTWRRSTMREKRRSMILSCQSACAAVTILIVSLASAVLRADEPRPAGHREGAIEQPVVAFRVEDDLPGKAGGSAGDISIPQAKASLAGFRSVRGRCEEEVAGPGTGPGHHQGRRDRAGRAGLDIATSRTSSPSRPMTLFAIGSCTKAFTTFVMGTLVDEGKLEWDTPLRTYIPELRM